MKNLFDLTGKVALVTGGNGGIGIGMAEGLAQHGATVIIWGTNADKNAAAVERLASHGGTVRSALVDVSDEDAVKAGIGEILGEFGRIDQAIANAGIGQSRKDMFDISLDDFRKLESINVHGVFTTLREAARHMIERHGVGHGGGSLVAVASTAAATERRRPRSTTERPHGRTILPLRPIWSGGIPTKRTSPLLPIASSRRSSGNIGLPTSQGSTLSVPAFAPDEKTDVLICTFFTSAFSSQPPPSGTSTPACTARPKLLCLMLGCSAVTVAGVNSTLEKFV